ncbi:hypothetical protein D3C87_601070 [compost metagenome]
MAFKKDANGNPIISPKQQAVLLYGQRLRGLGSVSELQKHLKLLGHYKAAELVRGAADLLKSSSLKEYEATRKELDPNFKDADDRFWDMIHGDK